MKTKPLGPNGPRVKPLRCHAMSSHALGRKRRPANRTANVPQRARQRVAAVP